MRIISGTWKGRTITAKVPAGVRPTLDGTRETIFNILQNYTELHELTVLDLFAGTGAFGFESLSRGASRATFVEKNRTNAELIQKTAESLIGNNQKENNVEIIRMDALRFLSTSTTKFDLIFIDPPYALHIIHECLHIITKRNLVANEGIVVAEHDRIEHLLAIEGMKLLSSRSFGDTVVDILQWSV